MRCISIHHLGKGRAQPIIRAGLRKSAQPLNLLGTITLIMTHHTTHLILTLAIAGTLAGCETVAVMSASASPVPAGRVASVPSVPKGVETAQMVITRDAGLLGSGNSVLLTFNNQAIAYFRTEETLSLVVPSGQHLVSLVQSPSFGTSPREYEINLRPGVKNAYRISITYGGIVLQRTSDR